MIRDLNGSFRANIDIFTIALRQLYILHKFLKFLISRAFQEHLKTKVKIQRVIKE